MAERYDEMCKRYWKNLANDAGLYACLMEERPYLADFYKHQIDNCLKYARMFKERYFKWKKIYEGA